MSGSDRYAPHLPLAQTSTVAHEMGHVLGLYHTHAQTHIPFSVTCPTIPNGWEPTNDNSQCECLGDFICDTPVDPELSGDTVNYTNCVWNQRQAVGAPTPPEPLSNYNPDTSNVMSYTHNSCRQFFTKGQERFMRNEIANSAVLQEPLIDCDNSCETFPFQIEGIHPEAVIHTVVDSNNNVIITDSLYEW